MMIHEVTAQAGKYKPRKRVGRGTGSGTGRRSGRGQKGASSRSGHASKQAFEGGQMPYFRRLRKFGFSNFNFTTRYWAVNLREILAHPSFAKGGVVSAETLIKAGLIRDTSRDLKILGDMPKDETLKVKLDITANRVSASAKKTIEAAGGKVVETGTRRDMVRGVDRMSDDKSPKNLTKKLKRGSKAKKPAAAEAPAEEGDAPKGKAAKGAAPAKGALKADAGEKSEKSDKTGDKGSKKGE